MIDQDALKIIVKEVLAEHPREVLRYRNGNGAMIGYLMGMVLKKCRGGAEPVQIMIILEESLKQ